MRSGACGYGYIDADPACLDIFVEFPGGASITGEYAGAIAILVPIDHLDSFAECARPHNGSCRSENFLLVIRGVHGYPVHQCATEEKAVLISRHLVTTPIGQQLPAVVNALLNRGFDSGRIESAVGVWADSNAPRGHWKVVYSPMRDGTGAWYIFAALMKTSAADYESHCAAHEGGLAITSFSEMA